MPPEPFPSDYNNAIDDALLAVDDNEQLEAPDTTPASGDLISREAAVGVLETGSRLADPDGVIPKGDPEYEKLAMLRDRFSTAALAIRALPTIQSAPSISAAIAELVTKWRERANAAEPEVNRTWDDFGAARINVTRQLADELDTALRALPPDARAVDGDLGVTPEVAEKLLRIREALAHDDIHEAWHWLYKVADSEVESLTPWAKLETRAAAITATNKD